MLPGRLGVSVDAGFPWKCFLIGRCKEHRQGLFVCFFAFFFFPASSVIFVERIWKEEKAKGCGKGTYSSFSKQFSFRTCEKVTKVKMTILNEKQVSFL